MTTVERLGPDDWREAREVRLAALADAPLAFASTYAREVGFDEETWRGRLEGSAWFVARDDGGRDVGLVALIVEGPREDHVVGMWVAPEERGRATADALLKAALASARPDAEAVVLWVADGNPRARRFYERAGFRSTEERQPLPSAPEVGEEKLRLLLRTPAVQSSGSGARDASLMRKACSRAAHDTPEPGHARVHRQDQGPAGGARRPGR